MPVRRIVAIGIGLAAVLAHASWLFASDVPTVPPAATKFLRLFQDLRDADAARLAGKYHHVSFQVSSTEINDYMRYALRATPRPGLDSVTVKIFAHGYVSTATLVDFDAVERWKPGTIPWILRPVLSGKKTISVDYSIQAENSRLSFSVEKAYYQDLRLPAIFVQEMIKIVAARQPEKYDTSKPLPLPFGLHRVWTSDHFAMGEN
jgi:hypothetical protein